MKNSIFPLLVLSILLLSCAPSQKITGTYLNKEEVPKDPFKSILILSLAEESNAKYSYENEMAKLISRNGIKAVKSTEVYIPKFKEATDAYKKLLIEAVKASGCEAVLVLNVLDVKTDKQYQPGGFDYAYAPMGYNYYASYYRYYSHYSPMVYTPGYYTTDKTYYLETSFYNIKTEKLIWSIKSEAYNPTSVVSWFEGYSDLLLKRLRKDHMIAAK